MVEKYNNTYHRSIKWTSSDARKPAKYQHVHNAFYAKVNARKATPPKFHVVVVVVPVTCRSSISKIHRKLSTLGKEYVTAMKTVKQRNMVNREMKLTIGDELQAADETRKELAPMKKALTDIDGALTVQRVDAPSKTPPSKNTYTTFCLHRRQDGQLSMGNKVLQLAASRKTLSVDDTEYNLTPGLLVLITQKHLRPTTCNNNDYKTYISLHRLKEIEEIEVNVALQVELDPLVHMVRKEYGEKMCFIKYHVSEDRSSIVELAGGVGTLR